ncbi:MAG: hypothetical protein I8H66_02420 [Sphingobacteriia bacterium]|nr:hypothetical protein [Sphingobacteriia bacterium]
MDLQYQQHIPAGFHDNSKVWIYQSSRLFSISEALELEKILNDFISNWESHGSLIKGYASLFFGQFIVLMADDSSARLCGSSADKSIRLIKEIEQKFNVDLLNRQSLGFIVKDKVEILPLNQLNYALENGFIDADTLYFNNLVTNKNMLLNDWLVPLKNSWLKTKLPNTAH